MINNRIAGAATLFALLILTVVSPANADQTGDSLGLAMTKLAPAIVSIDAVINAQIKAGGQSRDQDIRAQIHGTIISPDGLIMTAGGYFSSDRIKNAAGIPPDQTGFDIKIVPTEIKITIGNETQQYNGTIAASDSNLGLAFIQIRDLKGRTLPFIDIAAAAAAGTTPKVGDITVSAMRLEKDNDYAPYVIEDRIAGVITKPRAAYVPEGVPGGLGMPILDANANVIGVLTSFNTVADTDRESAGSQMLSELLKDELSGFHTQFIIAPGDIAPKIAEAKTLAANLPPFVPPILKPAVPATPPATGSGTTPPKTTAPAAPGDSGVVTK